MRSRLLKLPPDSHPPKKDTVTPEQKQLLYDELMKGTPEDPSLAMEFSQMVDHDLDRIEPLIDAMLTPPLSPASTLNGSPWALSDAVFHFLPDGTNILIHVYLQGKSYGVAVPRDHLRAFGEECIRQSSL